MLSVHLAALFRKLQLHRLHHHAATLCKTMPRQISSIQGNCDEQAGPDISGLAPHLQQEWDHAANAHLGGIIIRPHSGRKVWWSSSMCKTGHPHRWQAQVYSRTRGTGCPYDLGRAVCPCNDLAHNYPEVAAEWDWEANGDRSPETVTAGSNIRAGWRCGVCGQRWSALVMRRSQGTGCPRCGREASLVKTKQPSISLGAPHLLPEWDWEANERCGWRPDQITLGSDTQVHWVVQDECKLGLVHRWQAKPYNRALHNARGSPFPFGRAVCACNSLAVQCPEAATVWDHRANESMTADDVSVQSHQIAFWKVPDGRQWRQRVHELVNNVRRREATIKK